MKRLIVIAAMAAGVFCFGEAGAQKVIKDGAGNIFIDVQDMPASTFSTTTLISVDVVSGARNSIYKKLQIAKQTMPTWFFANSMCLPTSPTNYNNVAAVGLAQGASGLKQGCFGNYTEAGTTLGSWRLPTQRELILMYLMQPALLSAGLPAFDKVLYRSATESDSGASAWSVNFADGMVEIVSKSVSMVYRCVREVN